MQAPMNSLPKDPALLMKHLKELGNYKGSSQNRRYKQDIQRATLESRIMEAEDYTHTEEGVRRMRRYQEEVEMDEELALSTEMNNYYREQEKAAFRSNLRNEAEARLAAEVAAKEKKRQEALARRQEIIDQMRREKEEEEQRVRDQLAKEKRELEEAIAAEQREIERKLYEEKLAIQKFNQNRVQMELEEELSRMYEVEWKEQEIAQKQREQELAEQRAFAEEQRRRNEADELNRKQRVMELQMKKQRLLEMRKTQSKSKAETDAALAAARAESEAQAKRQRIQNKAMYVSKRMKAVAAMDNSQQGGAGTAEEGCAGLSDGASGGATDTGLDSIIEDTGGGPSKELMMSKTMSLAALSNSLMSPQPNQQGVAAQNAQKQALTEYRAHLLTLTDVDELRKLSKVLMAEKRQLRLQQRNSGGGEDPQSEAKETKRKLVECSSKEELVQQRIDELSKPAKKKPKPAAATTSLPDPVTIATTTGTDEASSTGIGTVSASSTNSNVTKSIAATWLANSLLQAGDAQKKDPSQVSIPFEKHPSQLQNGTVVNSIPPASSPTPAVVAKELSPLELLLKQCECLLRDIISATLVLGPLVERGITDEEFVKQSVVDARHRATSIELEIVSLGRKYKSLVENVSQQDPLEYMEQIHSKFPPLRKLMFKMGNYEVEHTAALTIAAEAERKRQAAADAEAKAKAERVAIEKEERARREIEADAEARIVAAEKLQKQMPVDQSIQCHAQTHSGQVEAQRLAVSSSVQDFPLVDLQAQSHAHPRQQAQQVAAGVQSQGMMSSSSVPLMPTAVVGAAPIGAGLPFTYSTMAPIGTAFAHTVVAGAPTSSTAAPGSVVYALAGVGTPPVVMAAAGAPPPAMKTVATSGVSGQAAFGYSAGGIAAANAANVANVSVSATPAAVVAPMGFGYTAGGVGAAISASTKNASIAPLVTASPDFTAPAIPSWQSWYTASAIAHASSPFSAPGGGSALVIQGDFVMGGMEFSLSDFMDDHDFVANNDSDCGSELLPMAKVPIGPGQIPVQFGIGQVPVGPGQVAVQFAPGQVPIAPGQVAVALAENQVAIGAGQVAVQLTAEQVPIAPGRQPPKRLPAGKVSVQLTAGQVPIAPGKVPVQLAVGQVAIAPGKVPVQLTLGQVPIAPGLQAIQLSPGQVAVAPGQEIEAVVAEDSSCDTYPYEPDSQGEYIDERNEEEDAFNPETLPGWTDCLHTTMATAAHHAAFYGFAEVLEFLSNCFDCYILDEKKRTPLFYACLRGHMDCVVILIGIDANWVDTGDHKGDTPIHAAAISNSTAVLKFLLQCCEVSPDTTNNEGMTPSHMSRSKSVLEVLYYANAQQYCVDNCNRNPLFTACSDGRVDCVDFLCRVTPAEYLLWPVLDTEDTALHAACANGHHACVDTLCQWLQTDSLYVTNKKGHTPAHVAKNAKVLSKLYENGADLFVADAKYRYPLFIASFYGRFDAVSFLLEVGATTKLDCINAKDINGDTALHAAALNGNTQCIVLLLYYIRAGPNKQGLTPKLISEKRIITPPVAASPVRVSDDGEDGGSWSHEEVINTIANARTSPRGPSRTRNTILIDNIESQFRDAYTKKDTNTPIRRPDVIATAIYGCSFGQLVYLLQTYGSRWCKCYDTASDSYYFYDRLSILNSNVVSSCWDRPPTFDELEASEDKYESACEILKLFYSKYNPDKMASINDILNLYRNRYGELFLQLAERYNVTDLRMFGGIDLSND